MAEQITLTAPVKADPGEVTFRVTHLNLNWVESEIRITLRGWNGTDFTPYQIETGYFGPEARVLMNALNTMNFATKSLHKRLIERLQLDGKLLAGTITGAPD